jgi:cystathionine gamma-synthase
LKMETKAVHAGRGVDPATGAVTPPIHLSTTFERDADGSYPRGYEYTRESNPNRDALEECVRELEGGAAAAAFSSGMAATMTVLQTLAPGDHVIVPDDTYFGTREIFRDLFSRWGVETSFVDMTDARAVGEAVRPSTRLFWVETPSNPRLKITDVRGISGIAREAGALLACDNTWATPVLQRPLELGADLVMHATTKYLGGHSDLMGGVVVAKSDDGPFRRIREFQHSGGAIPSPFECWLALRGIQTLPYRMRAHSENAARVARFLDGHPAVAEVFYPGLASHPGHRIASEQMSLFGGMLSFLVDGDRRSAMAVAANVRVFTRATSLGGTHSYIEHRASIEGPGTAAPENLLRLSVGLEHPDDLTDDLARALRATER